MSGEKSPPEFMDNDQEQHDDKLSDSDSDYKKDCNSQTGVLGCHQIQPWTIASIVLACLICTIVLGMTIGMVVGFEVQKNKISNLEQQSVEHNEVLQEMIYDLKLQLSRITVFCKQCNSTVHSSSYDDQELHAEQEELRATQNAIKIQLNNTILTLSNQNQQISVLRQETQENFTRSKVKLEEFVANISEHVDHLYMMRDDHSDQLSRINSNITYISTQLTHFNGIFNNLTSLLETQKTEVVSLASRMSTLNSRMDEIDRRDAMKDSQLEQSISQLDQHIRWIQTDSAGVSDQLSTINRRLDNLERSSAAAFYPLYCAVMVLISCMIMIFTRSLLD